MKMWKYLWWWLVVSPRMRPNRLRRWCDMLAPQWFLSLPLPRCGPIQNASKRTSRDSCSQWPKMIVFIFFVPSPGIIGNLFQKKCWKVCCPYFWEQVPAQWNPSPMRTSQRFVLYIFCCLNPWPSWYRKCRCCAQRDLREGGFAAVPGVTMAWIFHIGTRQTIGSDTQTCANTFFFFHTIFPQLVCSRWLLYWVDAYRANARQCHFYAGGSGCAWRTGPNPSRSSIGPGWETAGGRGLGGFGSMVHNPLRMIWYNFLARSHSCSAKRRTWL